MIQTSINFRAFAPIQNGGRKREVIWVDLQGIAFAYNNTTCINRDALPQWLQAS